MLILKPARILPMIIGVLVLFGCDAQRSVGPNDLPQFSRTITLPGFNSLLGTGPARVRIWLKPGTLIARRVVVRQGDQLTRDERVDGRVAAITASATEDTLTLSTADLKIVVNGSTKFRGQREEGDIARGIHAAPAKRARRRAASSRRGAPGRARNAAGSDGRGLHRRLGTARRCSRPAQHRAECPECEPA